MNATGSLEPKSLEAERLLIGEGVEEAVLFEALFKHLGISNIQVEYYEGKGKLGPYLKTLKTRPGFHKLRKLGVTRDADDNPAGANDSVRNVIASASFPESLEVRFLLLPAQNRPGALEDLCLAALHGQPIEKCIEEYFVCASATTRRNYRDPTIAAKARIHAWLASQDPPDLRLGHAATKGLLDWSSPAFDALKAFFIQLQA